MVQEAEASQERLNEFLKIQPLQNMYRAFHN
jgi:hypothetical protein